MLFFSEKGLVCEVQSHTRGKIVVHPATAPLISSLLIVTTTSFSDGASPVCSHLASTSAMHRAEADEKVRTGAVKRQKVSQAPWSACSSPPGQPKSSWKAAERLVLPWPVDAVRAKKGGSAPAGRLYPQSYSSVCLNRELSRLSICEDAKRTRPG
jgi:hypothetical protein